MTKILERYSGRKIKEGMKDYFLENAEELDETFLMKERISTNIKALIFVEKDTFCVRLVRANKMTAGRFLIVNALSDAAVKSLDKKMDIFFEKKE